MTSASYARWLGRLLTAVVLVSSGAYLLVYLYRWEWNRAVVAGIFFLAAELAVIGSGILRRLDDLARRLDDRSAEESADRHDRHDRPPDRHDRVADTEPDALAALAALRGARSSGRRPHFDWLDPRRGQLNVFVPVLLGAGAVLSALAYLVERVAGATAAPAADRAVAGRLGGLALPAGGLVGTGPVALSVAPTPPSWGRRLVAATLALGLTGGTWWAIDAVGDLTQDRPTTYDPTRATVVDLRFAFRDDGSVPLSADAVWASCRDRLPESIAAVELAATGPDRARLAVSPGLGEHAVRRFRGCLADLNLNRTLVTVEDLRHVPYRPGGGLSRVSRGS